MGDVDGARRQAEALGVRRLAALYVVFAALAFAVYAPSLRGEFLSDDVGIVVTNPYVHALTLENVRVILDPWGEAATYTANYAPVDLLVVALEWSCFGPATLGHHVVNVLAHALVSLLLVPLFVRAGLPRTVAVLAAAFFLLHPANVEGVAWIYQLKTILCLALGTGAVLLHPRRPGLAALLFALALLSKASAAFALPAAAYFTWRRARLPGGERPHWEWLGIWTLLLGLYAAPQLFAFKTLGETPRPLGADAFETLRTVAAIGARYVAMAATSYGASAFHHPPAARSWLDPWFLAGLVLTVAIAVRLGRTARRGQEEAGFWIWAAAAYAPVCQVFPFLYPMADRYLYVILPGLIGAVCLAGQDLVGRFGAESGAGSKTALRAGTVLACVVLGLFALRSHDRAAVFRNNTTLMLDSARHYPDGLSAALLRAQRAGRENDASAAAEALHRAGELGFDSFFGIDADPTFRGVRQDPRVREAVADLAGRWIEIARARGYSSPRELRLWAQAHAVRGEWAEAVALLERVRAQVGEGDAELDRMLAEARRQLAAQR